MKKFACLMFVIAVPIIFTGCAWSTTSTQATSSKPTHSAMYYWVHSGGAKTIVVLGEDVAITGVNDSSTKCEKVLSDVIKAMVDPPMPNQAINKNYQEFLSNVRKGAEACLNSDYTGQAMYYQTAGMNLGTVSQQFAALPHSK